MDPVFLPALRELARTELPYAECWRRLAPVAARAGRPRPTYAVVRRYLIVVRPRLRAQTARRERRLAGILAGRIRV